MRSVTAIRKKKTVSPQTRARKQSRPGWVAPMLATLTDTPFSSSGWIFEPKLDGVRCLALRSGSDAQLLSRNQKRLNEKYPELVDALQKLRADDFAVDGEIVIFDGGSPVLPSCNSVCNSGTHRKKSAARFPSGITSSICFVSMAAISVNSRFANARRCSRKH
jgi:hypothetical protein